MLVSLYNVFVTNYGNFNEKTSILPSNEIKNLQRKNQEITLRSDYQVLNFYEHGKTVIYSAIMLLNKIANREAYTRKVDIPLYFTNALNPSDVSTFTYHFKTKENGQDIVVGYEVNFKNTDKYFSPINAYAPSNFFYVDENKNNQQVILETRLKIEHFMKGVQSFSTIRNQLDRQFFKLFKENKLMEKWELFIKDITLEKHIPSESINKLMHGLNLNWDFFFYEMRNYNHLEMWKIITNGNENIRVDFTKQDLYLLRLFYHFYTNPAFNKATLIVEDNERLGLMNIVNCYCSTFINEMCRTNNIQMITLRNGD